jgi:hypothetical protein
MEYYDLDDLKLEQMMVSMLAQGNLFPVIGAGFTNNEQAKNYKVPNEDELKSIMLNELEKSLGSQVDGLRSKDFSNVAEHFLNPDFISRERSKKLIADYFTEVTLGANKKSFLNCRWPYVYTLNIDDAIEKNSNYQNKVLPNRKLSANQNSLLCVYKLHGDAVDELLYDETIKIIFSTGSYIRSITTNTSMLNHLKNSLVEQNVIFLGCRLTHEIDILYSLSEYNEKFPESRKGFFVTRRKLSVFDEKDLEKHGVNAVIKVDDYDSFYTMVDYWCAKARQGGDKKAIDINKYMPSDITNFGNDKNKNLAFLLKDIEADLEKKNIIPDFYIERDIERSVLKALDKNALVLIRGRRFSGKSMLLRGIGASLKTKAVYFFNSEGALTKDALNEMKTVDNGLFIFDTNVLTTESANTLCSLIEAFRIKNSSLLVAVNPTEPNIVGALIKCVSDDGEFYLEPKLSAEELKKINSKLDGLGIIKFDARSILENTFRLLAKYPMHKSKLAPRDDMPDNHAKILLFISIFDKVYSSIAAAIGAGQNKIYDLCNDLAPLLDLVPTGVAELRETGSRYKIVSNSKTGVALHLRQLIIKKGYQWMSNMFLEIATSLSNIPELSSYANRIIMFDSLNYVLSLTTEDKGRSGYIPVVRSLYVNLQPVFKDLPDYWLQRAKSVLSLETGEKLLVDGIDYALKAHNEAKRDRTIDNAEFTIALLYGKLCYYTEYKNTLYLTEAIKWFSASIGNYSRNEAYVKSMLEERSNSQNWFNKFCAQLQGNLSDPALLSSRDDIKHLLDVYKNWQSKRIFR